MSTRYRPLGRGPENAFHTMRSRACNNMLSAARRRRDTDLCPCLLACYSCVPRSGSRTLRRTATRCHSMDVAAPLLRAERTRCNDAGNPCGWRWNGQDSRPRWPRRTNRRGTPRHREQRARKRELAYELRRCLLPALSPVARLLWKCRLLPRNQVHRDPSSTLGDSAEEPPLSASRTATETERSCGLHTQSTMRPKNRERQLNRVSAFGSQHDKPGRQ